MRRSGIHDFARASIVNLVRREIAKTHPALLSGMSKPIDNLRNVAVPANDKRTLLTRILDEAGAEVVLAIGQGLRDGDFDPIWRAAARARDPQQLFHGWRRLEGYAHSTNRLEMCCVKDRQVDCRRYKVNGAETPSPVENLLICGVLIALLEIIGCHGVSCNMALFGHGSVVLYENGRFNVPDQRGDGLETTSWTIHWRAFAPKHQGHQGHQADLPTDPEISIPFPSGCNSEARRAVFQAATYLSADFLRQWKVSELARELGMSQRSLQRRLGEAELNYSSLVRGLRIQEACRLLEDKDTTLAAIGFCAGFSDSAHFSRDFRAATGTTPTAFRDALSSQ
ncbi:MAG: helix-turn-helix transcriptional regulator [Rhodospirillaceae bacterium]|jgi:AraC-like DNA-binding protein|nr:helix-turn-helix transcriptional regulator [Rhodospirillaceae bacterium]MBT4691591.1 helix-turn-helix transcriptional regulator [Rhodospirillaceae bacterium]MBT5079533.1 helix-turn-helix transcriptional regulator [Rhodospirillaceae bacterium]MBT5527317.1 helix-turn-helix transcriptional regulator [Rhodospirillaceae bacterium]MBT5879392.1 helix-turn-helix transcriptional regulator [Rhodospirillaceae bacterium]